MPPQSRPPLQPSHTNTPSPNFGNPGDKTPSNFPSQVPPQEIPNLPSSSRPLPSLSNDQPTQPVPVDAETQAKEAHFDYVAKNILPHLDWDHKHPSPPKKFKPFYFFQPAQPLPGTSPLPPQVAGSSGTVPASRRARDASVVSGSAIYIGTLAQEQGLEGFVTKVSGKGTKFFLAPGVLNVKDKRCVGKRLVVSE